MKLYEVQFWYKKAHGGSVLGIRVEASHPTIAKNLATHSMCHEDAAFLSKIKKVVVEECKSA